MGTNTNKMQGVGPSHETLKRSAGLPPARLVRNGDRVFTRSKVTASIGLKPMRLVVHHTRQKSIPISQFHSNTSCPDGDFSSTAHNNTRCPDDDFSSTAYSRRLQLHSIQHTAIVVLQTSSAPQHTATTAGQQKTPAPQHTADSRLWQHTAIMAVQQTTVAPQHTATTTI